MAWDLVCCNGMDEKDILGRFGHLERKKSEEFVKKVYVSEFESE